QRFTQGFNRRQGRRGVLWEERFKSVLVEGTGDPLSTMAAYIDLNPVRAGLVEDPKDYRWCGCGAAAAGDTMAREAIAQLMALAQRRPEVLDDPSGALATYRMWLFGQGEEREGTAPDGGSAWKGFSREAVLAVLAAKGKVSLPEYLRLRVRYFADGAVLGTREYVDGVFEALKGRWGPRRQDGARDMQGVAADLYVNRDLRRQVFG
ncbi:MAG: chemotaxis protein CheW, partial [Verrucomicrobiales bacterium]|nr:chemotaxis protein CheW [Verrucomicrobiales bacterium]